MLIPDTCSTEKNKVASSTATAATIINVYIVFKIYVAYGSVVLTSDVQDVSL